MPESRLAPPRASAMVEALRGLGYTAGTAIADVIDNSISAGASTVKIDVAWKAGGGSVTILDDGSGMDDAELEKAMRLGDRNPLDERGGHDLGRFGLGLKTASFSQGRRLTVASRKGGSVSVLRWDLDYLLNSADGGWHLLEGADDQSGDLLRGLGNLESGTLVIWELLDRMMPASGSAQDLLDLLDRIEKHLAMVFHRFIGDGRIAILLNGTKIKAWDPFLEKKTPWSSPRTLLPGSGSKARVKAYVLPHRDQLSAAEFEAAAGPEGWNSHQGFFVYRNDRLLLAGGWLGLGIDLCRLYCTTELSEWFGHIADASEELREEFGMMAASGGTPRDFGLKVQSHPVLMVTSRMKMRAARTLMLSFSGQLLETVTFSADRVRIEQNLRAATELLSRIGQPELPDRITRMRGGKEQNWQGRIWNDVGVDHVLDFLRSYSTSESALKARSNLIADFVQSLSGDGELRKWTVAVMGGTGGEFEALPGLALAKREVDKDFRDSRDYRIGRLLSPRDESVDLDGDEWARALAATKAAWQKDPGRRTSEPDEPNGPAVRHPGTRRRTSTHHWH